MAQYTIEKVSQEEPRVWHGPHGDVYYIKVKLEGVEKPVSIGKKKPDALSPGQTVYGTIEDSDLPVDKWVADKPPEGRNYDDSTRHTPSNPSGYKSNYQPRDDNLIRAQWAIGQAVAIQNGQLAAGTPTAEDHLEKVAIKLYAMVDRVKGSSESTDPKALNQTMMTQNPPSAITETSRNTSGYDKFKASKPTAHLTDEEAHEEEAHEEEFNSMLVHAIDDGTPINLDDIPF